MEPKQIDPAKARGRMKSDLWKDTNWYAQEKLDGVRYLWHMHEDHSHFTSRRISKKTGKYVDKGESFPHLMPYPDLVGSIFDGEMMPAEGKGSSRVIEVTGCNPQMAIWIQDQWGWLRYALFDVLFYQNVDVRGWSYGSRLEVISKMMKRIHLPHVFLPQVVNTAKQHYCDLIMEKGGEGVILKHRDALYGDHLSWVKVKREETFDVVITGFKDPKETSIKTSGEESATKFAERGWIGAIEFDHNGVIGYCSGMDEGTREFISTNPDACVGRVIEVRAQEVLESGALRHPRFVRFREDK
ncbi:MAG: ATP-dependent DNA ligase [bacterium]